MWSWTGCKHFVVLDMFVFIHVGIQLVRHYCEVAVFEQEEVIQLFKKTQRLRVFMFSTTVLFIGICTIYDWMQGTEVHGGFLVVP